MANLLNDHFISVGPKLNEQMTPGREMHVTANVDEASFNFNLVDINEVAKLLQGLSASKSCGVAS